VPLRVAVGLSGGMPLYGTATPDRASEAAEEDARQSVTPQSRSNPDEEETASDRSDTRPSPVTGVTSSAPAAAGSSPPAGI